MHSSSPGSHLASATDRLAPALTYSHREHPFPSPCRRDQGRAGEAFGDFVARKGFDAIRKFSESYDYITPEPVKPTPKAKVAVGAGAATATATATAKKAAPAAAGNGAGGGDNAKAAELLAALSAKAAAEGKTLEEYLGSILQ